MDQSYLIKRCQVGDKQAFEELYHRYCNQAIKTAYLISGQRGIAEDIVQEAFIQCYKQINQLKEPEAFHAWFYKILIRCGWRMASRNRNGNSRTGLLENYNNIIDRNLWIDDLVETKEAYLRVQQALEKLTTPLRTVVTLYYYNNMSIAEIALALGCVQGTVKSRLHNAKKMLKKEMKRYFSDDDLLVGIEKQKESISNG